MTSNSVCNGVTTRFVTLTPTQPDPARPSPAQPLSFGHLPSIAFSYVGQRATRDAWMVGSTQTHTDTGLATIEGIDLDADVPCDGFGCIEGEHPADYIIGFVWPHGHIYRGARCNTWWKSDVRLRCMHCDVSAEERDDVAHIVEVLR